MDPDDLDDKPTAETKKNDVPETTATTGPGSEGAHTSSIGKPASIGLDSRLGDASEGALSIPVGGFNQGISPALAQSPWLSMLYSQSPRSEATPYRRLRPRERDMGRDESGLGRSELLENMGSHLRGETRLDAGNLYEVLSEEGA